MLAIMTRKVFDAFVEDLEANAASFPENGALTKYLTSKFFTKRGNLSPRFAYQRETDCYKCPAGRTLSRHHFVPSRGYYEYRTKRGICERCRLRQLCTRDKNGRTLKRFAGQELLNKARKQSHSPAAHCDPKRRHWFQERNFGEAAVHHGFKRARWRGLWKQSIQDYFIAGIQNFRIMARRRLFGCKATPGWFRKHFGNAVRIIASIRCHCLLGGIEGNSASKTQRFGQQPLDDRKWVTLDRGVFQDVPVPGA